jgi:very-short-patch-repair endonuclease
MDRKSCDQAVAELAAVQDGVVSRRQLRLVGIDHDDIRREVESGRWVARGTQTIGLHRGVPSVLARRWSAIWETGAAIGVLDGVSALQHAGLTGYQDDEVHLSVVHNHNTRPLPGVRIHKVIRRIAGEVVTVGVPRTRPEVAAIRAAHWARSNRQAALLLIMPVQQRLTTPVRLVAAQRLIRGRTRRALIRNVVRDIAFGVQSLGELDFAALCRARGLPEPMRQVVRQGPRGRIYLDVRWDDHGLVVEIDGVHHGLGLNPTDDNLRQNSRTLAGDRVLRIDVVGLRLETDLFMDQVQMGLRLTRAA